MLQCVTRRSPCAASVRPKAIDVYFPCLFVKFISQKGHKLSPSSEIYAEVYDLLSWRDAHGASPSKWSNDESNTAVHFELCGQATENDIIVKNNEKCK